MNRLLVEDGVNGNRSFAGLAVSNNRFCPRPIGIIVNGCDPSLHRFVHDRRATIPVLGIQPNGFPWFG